MNDLRKYNAVRDSIKTGDLIAFSGTGFISSIIKLVTMSEISHVGIAIVDDSAFMGKMVCVAEVRMKIGVQINLLRPRLEEYKGKIWVYSLKEELLVEQELALVTAIRKEHTEKIKYNYKQAVKAAIDIFDNVGFEAVQNKKENICSGFVGRHYKGIRIIDTAINFAELTPDDCRILSCVDSLSRSRLI